MKQEGIRFNLLLIMLLSVFIIFLFNLFTFATSYLPGDFCGPMGDPTPDGKVDFNDLMVFATAYGSETGDPNWNALCDICGYLGDPSPDGKVNFDDLMVFATNYGKSEGTEIPELTEAISQNIDLSIGGTIEVDDPESIINGVKLTIPPMPSEKRGGKSTATMTISYIDDPYSLELPDNRGFLLPPVVINSDVTLDYECILEIPYTEATLSNMGLSSNEDIIIYHYNYISSSWEEVTANKRNFKDKTDFDYIAEEKQSKTFYLPFGLDWMPIQNIDSIYVCSYAEVPPPFDLGFPQPGDLLYRKSNYGIFKDKWLSGHVGIYVGEKAYDGVILYNVIEALHRKSDSTIIDEVMKNYYNPISEFAFEFNTTYMGARQPDSGALTLKQRNDVLEFLANNEVVGKPYAWDETNDWFHGLARGELVKGDPPTKGLLETSYNCVGLAEKAYEIALVNGGIGLVTEEDEGNNCIVDADGNASFRCALTPPEQYTKTEPAEGYSVSGKVSDSQDNGIPGVTLNFELVSSSFKETTDSDGKWSSGKLGREWKVTPQKDGYTFEPSNIKVTGNANDIDFTGTTIYNYPIVDSFSVTPTSIILGDSFNISYTVSDDIGLQQTELWRVNDVGGEPGDWDTSYNPIFTKVLSGQKNYSGSFTDTPDTAGTYWYGMHVVDTSGNWSVEPKPPGPIVVTVTSVIPETYTITTSVGPNGSISPSGDVIVNEGSDKSFTIIPDTGYQLEDVLVDGSHVSDIIGGESVEGVSFLYLFTNVTKNHTIVATFSATVTSPVHNFTKNTYYNTIQAALDDADSGNTIEVDDGTYTENVAIIKDHITLKSKNGAEKTTIEAADSNNDTLLVKADYAYINGFTIEGAGAYYFGDRRGGIHFTPGVENCTISNNIISNNTQGIFIFTSHNNIISNNIISNNSIRGVLLEAADYNTFSNNTIDSNGSGIDVNAYFGLTGTYYSYNNTIINNIISNNGAGIRISGGSDNLAYLNNVIDNNTNGSSSLLVTSPWNSPEEITYSYNGTSYTNYLGNYWSNYTESDSNGDGIGDTPYIINAEPDNYPLMESFENY
jgi:parallel beta-helix repeat protein